MILSPQTNRFESLDALRGVAILGIFAVNIFAFAFPWYALANPSAFTAYEDNGAFWWGLSAGIFQFKFITIFSALFGAGIMLTLGKDASESEISLHRHRMFWLLMIGIIHNYLLWYGVILAPYAIAGFLLIGARHWTTKRLLKAGSILIMLNYILYYLQDLGLQFIPAEDLVSIIEESWAPPPEAIQAEFDLFRSSYFDRLPHTLFSALMGHLMQGGFFMMRIIGVMMFGMALFRSGFFTLGWSSRRYLWTGLVASIIGAAGSFWSAHDQIAANFHLTEVFQGQTALYWASLIQAFGYAALVMLACTVNPLKIVRAPFAAAGRLALSNYLATSLIGIFIFFGPPGLGKFGTMNFEELAKVVGAVWLFILIWSPLWLLVFRFGPAEWVWRSLSYRRLQPILK